MSESRQANPIPEVPLNAPREAGTNIWTPSGLEHVQSWVVGRAGETGKRVLKHEFRFTFRGETRFFGVVAHEDESAAHIEDMAAGLVEREAQKIIETLQERGSKLVPEDVTTNIAVRRELAAVMRDYIRYARKRAASTNNKLYYPAVTV